MVVKTIACGISLTTKKSEWFGKSLRITTDFVYMYIDIYSSENIDCICISMFP